LAITWLTEPHRFSYCGENAGKESWWYSPSKQLFKTVRVLTLFMEVKLKL
jgi:hypothetical protein